MNITKTFIGADAGEPVVDGRAPALEVCRGVSRWLAAGGYQPLPEFVLRNGRRADVVGIDDRGTIAIVEIKTSVADLRADRKWPEYLPYCDLFFFAVPAAFDTALLPDDTGILVADGHGADVVRPAAVQKVAPSRRRAVMLRYGLAAASRLHRMVDPGLSGL